MVNGWLLAAIFLVVVCHGEDQERGNISASRKFYPEVAPVKTIQSKEGDVIDCVDIYSQPSLAHPLLKNHKIQMKPTGVDSELVESRNSSVGRLSQPWHAQSGGCPDGSVPIARTHNNNTVAHPVAPLIPHPHQFHVDSEPSSTGGTFEWATVFGSTLRGGPIHGAVAEWSVWEPHVDSEDELSAATLRVIKKSLGDSTEWISVGWMVNKKRFGNDRPTLFAYFGSNLKGVDCIHAGCGFVQISKKICLGAKLWPSTPGKRETIQPIEVQISLEDKLWKLFVNGEYVGHWPAVLFQHLRSGASHVSYGGEVLNTWPGGLHSRTEMGNGRFPKKFKSKYDQVACFKRCEYIRPDGKRKSFWKKKLQVSNENCYAATLKSGENGFCYGGPGYNDNCQRRG